MGLCVHHRAPLGGRSFVFSLLVLWLGCDGWRLNDLAKQVASLKRIIVESPLGFRADASTMTMACAG